LERAIKQCEQLRGLRPSVAIADRGYKGKKKIGDTEIVVPNSPKKTISQYEKKKVRERFRRRASIEPVIGHLKTDNRLSRNFLRGIVGDQINVMLAAAAFNFRKWMRKAETFFVSFYRTLERLILGAFKPVILSLSLKITF
jgi:IS5 family transposase